MDELTESGRLPFDPDSEIERMREVLDLDEHYLHRTLDERIGVLPEELRAAFAYEVACRDEAVCGRIAMYWLLDDSAEVRLGAAEGVPRTGAEGSRRAGLGRAGAADPQLDAGGRRANAAGRGPGRSAASRAGRAPAATGTPAGANLRLDPRQVGHADAARGLAGRKRTGPRDGRYGIEAGDRRGRGDTGHGKRSGSSWIRTYSTR